MFRFAKSIAVVYAILFTCTPGTTLAKDYPTIMVTIKPFYNLCAKVMQSVGTPELLLKNNTSPHDYHLKPSDAQLIKDATLIIWGGPDLDGYIEKPIASIAKGKNLNLATLPGLNLLPLRTSTNWHQHDHSHHHSHGSIDPHYWLDPANAVMIIRAIATRLAEIDPANATIYHNNADDFVQQLKLKDQSWQQQLRGSHKTSFIVFHDAYQYFNKYYDLDEIGSISINPEIPPSVQRIQQIQTMLRNQKIDCIFSEPQFDAKIINTLTSGLDIYKGILDPLGEDKDLGPNGYIVLINNLADTFVQCSTYK